MVRAIRKLHLTLGVLLAALAAWPCGTNAEEDRAQVEFFELHVRPILAGRCAGCHDGGDDAESVLTFDSRDSLIEGGDFGPAIVLGKAKQSLLWRAINGTHKELRMPPEGEEPLTREQVAAFEKWIDAGAVWPEGKPIVRAADPPLAKPSQTVAATARWSFPPRRHVDVPDVDDEAWAQNDIDRFILRKLQEQGLRPGTAADKRTLVRRMYFDMIGLPPSPEEMQTAQADESPEALAKVVDRLLASRHYGERWGRHWLDVARYADTQGDVGDVPIPQAYRYRNWVIDASNADMPYDRFVQLQLAGDLIARDVDDLQQRQDMTAATGFLALSRRFGNEKQDDIHLTIEDSIDTIGRGIMGVTLRCARCHDHKFDPMAMTDYYGLYGILASTRYPWMGMSNEKSPSQLVPVSLEADAPAAQRRVLESHRALRISDQQPLPPLAEADDRQLQPAEETASRGEGSRRGYGVAGRGNRRAAGRTRQIPRTAGAWSGLGASGARSTGRQPAF